MSTENTNIDTPSTDDNLDLFAAQLFSESEQPPEDATPEKKEVVEEDSGAPEENEDTQTPTENDGTPEANEDGEDSPKKGNRYQERINEITAARRAAERVAEERAQEIAELKRQISEQNKATDPAPETKPVSSTDLKAPSPSDENEDGTPKYPLGVYDPKYLQDNIQYLFKEQEAQRALERQQQAEQEKLQNARSELEVAWQEKLVTAQERYPDFQEKGQQMLAVFEGIDETYGQYLTDTIMEMDAGPDVFYYLANNIEEAQKIVSAGPRKATIALAKLESQLSDSSETSKTPRLKVTKAPTPPPQVKGSAVVKPGPSPDTDDLEAFSKELFRK